MTQAKFFEYDEKEEEFEEEEELRAPRKPGEAPDGGWGWMVVLGSFLVNLFVEGLIISFPVGEISEGYMVDRDSVRLIGVLLAAFCHLGGPLAGALIDRYGCRKVTIVGSVITCAALVISTYMPNVAFLTLTYGCVAGIGLSMTFLPSLVIVATWFNQRRALATGLAMMGSAVGYFIFEPLYKHLLSINDWKYATVIIGAVFMHCAIGGALFRPLTHAKPNCMKRGVIQHGAIMKALIAEKARQRTISNGSLDNCIITKDNRLIKIDKIDLSNKSTSFRNKLKMSFGFSSRSLNRSKNSLVVPTVVVDPIYRPAGKSSPAQRFLKLKPQSTPPTPKRDSGCGGSLDSPNLQSKSYEALPPDDPWDKDTNLVVTLPPERNPLKTKVSASESTLSTLGTAAHKLEPKSFSNNATPVGSGRSLNLCGETGSIQTVNGRNKFVPVCNASVAPSGASRVCSADMSTIYEEHVLEDFKLVRKISGMFNFALFKSPTFWLLITSTFFSMIGYVIPFSHLPAKAMLLGESRAKSMFLISILWVASLIGRVCLGWVADRRWATAVQLNNSVLFLAGVMSFCVSQFDDNGLLSFYAFAFGFFTAAFLALRSIIVIELFGKDRLPNTLGMLLFFQGLAILAGYQLSNVLEGDLTFYVVGVMLCGSAIIGFPLNRLLKWEMDRAESLNSLKIVEIEEIPASARETLRVEQCESSF